MNLQRLDKIISTNMNISRSEARTAIKHGKVSVDGKVFRDASAGIDPKAREICFFGQAVTFKEHIYIVMNKPKGVLSASTDNRRETVVDLVPKAIRRNGLAPVGRLDKDTTGLLLLTDDGKFAHRVISPKSNIKKLYEVTLDAPVPAMAQEKFSAGVTLADGTECLPAKLEILNTNTALVEIQEGKYHQIKRMFGTVGLGVNELKRIKIGKFSLPAELSEGECRELSLEEIKLILPDFS